MKLYLMKKQALELLKQEIPNNISNYSKTECWVGQFFSENNIPNYRFDSGIEVEDFKLLKGDSSTDAQNAEILYNALHGKINMLQASDLRLWADLAHHYCWDYMTERWAISAPAQDEEEAKSPTGRIGERYFFEAKNNKAFVRQGLARLYWASELTYNEDNPNDPFELTKYIFSRQDILLNSTERLLGRNKTILQALLTVLKSYEDQNGALSRSDIRTVISHLNREGGLTVLDALSKDEAIILCQKELDDVLSLPLIDEGDLVKVRIEKGKESSFCVKDGKLIDSNQKEIKTKPSKVIGTRLYNSIKVQNKKAKVIEIHT